MTNEITEMDVLNHEPDKFRSNAVPPKPFPYWPPNVSNEEMIRMELMMELNKWANNDPLVAKRAAETLILILKSQFNLE